MNYTTNTEPASKTTITISRQQLWKNFIECWSDIAWDDFNVLKDCNMIQEVGRVLCEGELNHTVRGLFRDGHTIMLIGDGMKHIDLPADVRDKTLLEIVVVDGDKRIVVDHSDIKY